MRIGRVMRFLFHAPLSTLQGRAGGEVSQRAADGAAAAHGALLPRRRQSSPVNFPNLDFGVLPGAKNGAAGRAAAEGEEGGGRRC